jgi:hypothetical protein
LNKKKVFLTTAGYSVFAYLWMYAALVIFTPDEVTVWEAIITLLSCPLLVVHAYMQEKNFFFKKEKDPNEAVYNLADMCK